MPALSSASDAPDPAALLEDKGHLRVIAASFAAGVGAMALFGFVMQSVASGGLAMQSANASAIEAPAPAVELDVAAVRATLADADRHLAAARAATRSEVSRLEAISAR